MKNNVYHIVGCGLVGTLLSFQLAYCNVAKEIHIYDYDTMSAEDIKIYPCCKKTNVINMPKVYLLKTVLDNLRLTDLHVIPHYGKFPDSLDMIVVNNEDIYIDCRDNKKNDFYFDLRVSLDGNLLLLDTYEKDKMELQNINISYLLPKEIQTINLAISVCTNFVINNNFNERNKIFYYDLDRMKHCYSIG